MLTKYYLYKYIINNSLKGYLKCEIKVTNKYIDGNIILWDCDELKNKWIITLPFTLKSVDPFYKRKTKSKFKYKIED